MRVARVLVGAAVVLAAAGCSGEKASQPTGGKAPATSAAPAASPQAVADTLALGKVVANGKPRAGVPVFAVAWPKSEVLDGLKEGADVQTAVVARATTDASGLFQLRLKPSDIDPLYLEDAGDVQMEIVVDSESGPSWEFTATQGDKGWSTTDAAPGKDRPFEAELEVDPASGELKVKRLDTIAEQG